MKIKSTFKVVLESEDGNAELIFRKPKINEFLERQVNEGEKISPIQLKKLFTSTLGDLVDVKGLEHEDGRPVLPDEVKDLNLDIDTCLAIIAGYNAGLNKKSGDPEKKDS